MPYVWQDNEVFLSHEDVTIYHVYKDDMADGGVRSYWYATTAHGSDYGADDGGEFDVRDLKSWKECPVVGGEDARIKAAIKIAIENGELDNEGEGQSNAVL